MTAVNATLVAAQLSTYDALALFGVALPSTLLMVTCAVGSAIMYRRYAPLRARNVPNLVFMTGAGLVHLWAANVVVLRQVWPSVYFALPVLWTPWLEYFFGLGLWLALLMLRPFNYSFVFRRRLRSLSQRRRALLRLGAFLVMLAPALLLALIGTFRPIAIEAEQHRHSDGGGIDDMPSSEHSLTHPSWYTVLLAVWLTLEAAMCAGLLVFISYRRHSAVTATKGGEFAEFEPLRFALSLSGLVLLIVGVLRSMPSLHNGAGVRAFVVVLLSLMHTAVVLRYLAMPLWHAVRRDQRYADQFLQRWVLPEVTVQRSVPPRFAGTRHLLAEPQLLALFVLFCRTKMAADNATMALNSTVVDGATSDARRTRRMVDCLSAIEQRRQQRSPALLATGSRNIIALYLSPTLEDQMPGAPPDGVSNWSLVDEAQRAHAELFDRLRLAIIEELHRSHWDAFSDHYTALVDRWNRNLIEQRRIMQQDGLLDPIDIANGGGGTVLDTGRELLLGRPRSDSEDDDGDGSDVESEGDADVMFDSNEDDNDGAVDAIDGDNDQVPVRKHRRRRRRGVLGGPDATLVLLPCDVTSSTIGASDAAQRWRVPQGSVTRDIFEYAHAVWSGVYDDEDTELIAGVLRV